MLSCPRPNSYTRSAAHPSHKAALCISFVSMENFVVSARKYRPAVFGHVVGQTHITTTLKNAVKNKHLAQAFLFCGPRGVGKTTCARILAKTINCLHLTADTEPCNACTSCTSFNKGSATNVYELDAASNNSVEDIRALVEQVRYPPPTGQYKVYIIDEVHMLSNHAFNAFLKTLEEPPSYAVFILATTEKHKIIPTILSRCQLFDFHRIQPQDSVEQLKYIAAQEGIAYEEEALHLISQKAEGALRDALSIFDLMATFAAGQTITYQAARTHLHVLDHTYYFRLIAACLQGDPGTALLIYDEILKAGFEGQHFLTGLSEHLRHLLVSQDEATWELLTTADSVKAQYKAQAAQISTACLYQALHIVQQCALQYKNSYHQRLHVELALIDLAALQAASQATPGVAQSSVPLASVPAPTSSSRSHAPLPGNAATPSRPTATPQLVPAATVTPPSRREERVPHPVPTDTSQPVPATNETPPSRREERAPHSEPAATVTPPSRREERVPHPVPTDTSQPVPATNETPPRREERAPHSEPAATLEPPTPPGPALTTTKLPRLDQLKASLVSTTEAASTQPAAAPAAARPLTRAAVEPHWQAYAQQLKAAGKMSEYSVLSQDMHLEGHTLVVQLVNAVQQDLLAGLQEELIGFLQQKLQCTDLQLQGVVASTKKARKPYTAQEKFDYLAAKHPDLRLLQKQLTLEVQG